MCLDDRCLDAAADGRLAGLTPCAVLARQIVHEFCTMFIRSRRPDQVVSRRELGIAVPLERLLR